MLYKGLFNNSTSGPRILREQVYAQIIGGSQGEGLQCFNRNMSSGALTQQSFKSAYGIRQFKISSEKNSVYYNQHSSRTVTKLVRSMTDGSLSSSTSSAISAGSFYLNNVSVVEDLQISPDSNYVYVCSRYGGAITVFNKNMASLFYTITGTIASPSYPGDLGAGPVSMALSKTNKLYVNNATQGNIQTFTRNLSTGALTSSSLTTFNLLGNLLISPDDNHLYLWTDTRIEIFSTAGSGLTYVSGTGISGIRSIVFSQDGKFLYIGLASTIIFLNRNTNTGELSSPSNNVIPGSSNYGNLVISLDDKYIYSSTDRAIESYKRNVVTGALTYNGQYAATHIVANLEVTSF